MRKVQVNWKKSDGSREKPKTERKGKQERRERETKSGTKKKPVDEGKGRQGRSENEN